MPKGKQEKSKNLHSIVKDQNFSSEKFGFPEYSQGALRGNFSVLDHKRNTVIFIVIIVIICILGVSLYSNIIEIISIYEKKVVYAQVIVGNDIGIAVNGTALIFGMVRPGGGDSKKEVFLENTYPKDVRFKIYSKGNISDFLIVSENNFILAPRENRTIVFNIRVPRNASLGTYDGNVYFVIQNPIIK